MAEIAILLAIKKISIAVAGEMIDLAKPLLAKTAGSVASLPTNMELIKEELEIINVFLIKIGTRGCNDTVLDTWINQVRRLAYDIEDIVDQFIYVVGERQRMGFWSILWNVVRRPQALLSLDRIATELQKINEKLRELSCRRDRWIMPTLGGLDIEMPDYVNKPEVHKRKTSNRKMRICLSVSRNIGKS